MGHIRRMQYLQMTLYKHNINMLICSNQQNVTRGDIYILDRRDTSFGEDIMQQDNTLRIAVDNQGIGRQQAHILWDTLPHPSMNIHEFKQSLRHMLLPDLLTRQSSRANLSCIEHVISYRHMVTSSCSNDSNLTSIRQLSSPQYNQSNNDTAQYYYTYFGQTLFERLYQGKNIYLTDISKYHRQLSTYFLCRWKNLCHHTLYLDGRGNERLIQQLIHLSNI